MTNIVPVPYEDYVTLSKDSADKKNVMALLETEFKDAECQLTAVKAVLDIVEKEEEPTNPVDPVDPTP